MNLLLSYPRSGNTWLRYMISNTSDIMCLGQDLKENIRESQSSIGINGNHPKKYDLSARPKSLNVLDRLLIKCHDLEEIRDYWKPEKCGIDWFYPAFLENEHGRDILDILYDDSFRLVFLYRDPFEVCSRGKNYFYDIEGYAKIFKQYMDYRGEKIIIDYQDLLADPEGVLYSVLLFLGRDIQHSKIIFNKFFKHIEQHKKGCIRLYEEAYGYKSYTKGDSEKNKFHQSTKKGKKEAYKQLKKEVGSVAFDLYFMDNDMEEEDSVWESEEDNKKMELANKEARLRGAAMSLGIPEYLIYKPPIREEIKPIGQKKEEIPEKIEKVGFLQKCFGVLFGRRGSNKY